MTIYRRNYPIPLSHPVTDEDIDVECFFYYTKGFPATSKLPAEPPEVELIDVRHNDESIMNILGPPHIKGIEGHLLEYLLE